MTAAGWVFDALLASALPVLAWRVLATRDLFQAVVLFISFGLLVALAWVRLGAPDIALAEAAIGAGLTGALFLNTLGRLRSGNAEADDTGRRERPESADRRPRPALVRVWIVAPAVLIWAALSWSLLSLPEPAVGLGTRVADSLPESGVGNPVTAVLLNFRSYDTLLEVGVLLLAVLAVWSLGLSRYRDEKDASAPDAPVLRALVRLLAPVMVLATGYLLLAGTSEPGGAFQAGAVLGALGVLLLLAGMMRLPPGFGRWLKAGLAAGLGVFLAVGLATPLFERAFLDYPQDLTYALILLVEAVLTVSIGLTLAALFLAAPPEKAEDADEASPEDAA